jgi:hypothetical protein
VLGFTPTLGQSGVATFVAFFVVFEKKKTTKIHLCFLMWWGCRKKKGNYSLPLPSSMVVL